jgi:hypothetical protein
MDLAFWRDMSLVLLCLEAFVIMLVPGAIFFYSIKGMRELEKKMREVSPQVHGVFHRVNQVTRQTSDKVASPFIAVSAANAQVKAMWRGKASLIKRQEV